MKHHSYSRSNIAKKVMEKIAVLIMPILLITGFIILEIEKHNRRGGLQ